MSTYASLRALLVATPALPDRAPILVPETIGRPSQQNPDALLGPGARFIVPSDDAQARMGYKHWLRVGTLHALAPDAPDEALRSAIIEAFGRHTVWADRAAPAEDPALAWPTLPDEAARLDWYADCAASYRSLWNRSANATVSRAELQALEDSLGCALPAPLRSYHLHIGQLDLAERLCAAPRLGVDASADEPIQPLLDAYPGIPDLLEDLADAEPAHTLIEHLVAFGDYLGNGNLWCFHRETSEVWYFDHDTAPHLTRLFPSVADYLDALMVKCLLEVHGMADDEDLLRAHLGDQLVQKRMY